MIPSNSDEKMISNLGFDSSHKLTIRCEREDICEHARTRNICLPCILCQEAAESKPRKTKRWGSGKSTSDTVKECGREISAARRKFSRKKMELIISDIFV